MKPNNVTDEELKNLKEYFVYESGNLKARISYANSKIKAGKILGNNNPKYYTNVRCKGRKYKMHRIVWYLCTGNWPIDQIDHINGDKSDNRIENLRQVSHGENMRSYKKKAKGTSSRFRGVSFNRKRKEWHSEIYSLGLRYSLGWFKNELEAAMAYNIKAQQLNFNKQAFNRVFEDVQHGD